MLRLDILLKALDRISDTNTPTQAVFGPAATLWFSFLQRRIVFPKRPNLEILAKVGLDQVVFASTNLFVFLNTMALAEGTDPKKKLESTYFSALSKNWMLWPPVQAINFKFVPLNLRVLVVNVVALGESFFSSVFLFLWSLGRGWVWSMRGVIARR